MYCTSKWKCTILWIYLSPCWFKSPKISRCSRPLFIDSIEVTAISSSTPCGEGLFCFSNPFIKNDGVDMLFCWLKSWFGIILPAPAARFFLMRLNSFRYRAWAMREAILLLSLILFIRGTFKEFVRFWLPTFGLRSWFHKSFLPWSRLRPSASKEFIENGLELKLLPKEGLEFK